MHVISLCVRLHLEGSRTPRQKRKRVEAIVNKLKGHFNAAVIELAREEVPDELVLAVALVGRTRREARDLRDHILDALAVLPESSIVDTPSISEH